MKKYDWSTRKFYGRNGTLIKMEHTYYFQNQYNSNNNNSQSYDNNPSKYVYVDDKSKQKYLKKEKSMYKSELDFPYQWKENIGANLGEDSEEEKKFKEEWFAYVKSKRLGKNWKGEKRKLEINDNANNRNLVIHQDKFYEEWVKRKTMVKKSFITFELFSKKEWDSNNETVKNKNNIYEVSAPLSSEIEFKPDNFATDSSYLDGLPCHPEVFSNIVSAFPESGYQFPFNAPNNIPSLMDFNFDKKFVREENLTPPKSNSVLNVPEDYNCDLDVPYNDSKDFIESPLENFTKAEPKLEFNDKKVDVKMNPPNGLIEGKKIFKNPTTGKIKSIRSDIEAVLTAKWENKNVDIIFFKWGFIPQKGEKLTINDSLRTYLKIGQDVNFHGARMIPGTDKYQTFLVYDGNIYPSLARRSGYDLKKWSIDKDLYTFPRRAVVKNLVLPYHAVIEIEAPARNVPRKITSVAMEICFVNKYDECRSDCWMDEYVQVGDTIYVELTFAKWEGSALIRKAWKFPEERILLPKPITSPNFEVPMDKFVFCCKEGKKSVTGTVSDIFTDRGILVTSIKGKTYEIHFHEVYIDGHEASFEDLLLGTEVTFRNFRRPPACEEFWTPLVWKGPPPKMQDLMRPFEAENSMDAVVDTCSIYVGTIERFILPAHAVIRTKSNNDLVIFVSVSKNEILSEAPDFLWIDKIITMNDVLTFKIKKLSPDRYTAIQVYV